MLLTQWAAAFGSFNRGEESALPYHPQGSVVVGALSLLPEQLPGHRPVYATVGTLTCILQGDALIRRVLEESAESLFHPVHCGEARRNLDSVRLEVPEPWALQASCGETPGGRVAGFDAMILEVRDHRCHWPFDQSPTLGRRQKLGLGDLPEAQVVGRHRVRKQELVEGAPVLQDHCPKRVAAVAFA